MQKIRDLDGFYFRVKRDGKWQNICFSDLTPDEKMEVGKDKSLEWWRSLAIGLGENLYTIGEEFDLVREIPE